MGGEGSALAAIKSLKNNRALLKRKGKKPLSGSYANIKLKEFPNATPTQLQEIKKRIQKENKVIRNKHIFIFVILCLALVAFFTFITK